MHHFGIWVLQRDMTGRETGYLQKQQTVSIKLKLKLPWGLKYIYTQKLLFKNLSLVIPHQCKFIVLLIFFFFLCLTINIQKGLLILCGFWKFLDHVAALQEIRGL